jgi:glycerol-3-phosphate dehydrogenase
LREGHATESRERWREVGIPVCEHPSDDFLRRAGAARDVRSFVTPDSVMDYRGLVAEVLRQARADGAVVWPDARCVRLVPQGGPAPAVVVQTRTGEQVVRGRHCVVAAGAWAPELLATAGVDVPVDRWKTHVVRFAVALVDQITVNVGPPLLILVPFAGSTLVGDARRVPASADDDLSVDGVAVAAMLADLTHTFPGLGTSGLGPPTAYAGIKSESRSQGSRAQEPVVLDHTSHGVDGLVVVFPGKASLMFAVADDIVTRLSGGDMANRDADH